LIRSPNATLEFFNRRHVLAVDWRCVLQDSQNFCKVFAMMFESRLRCHEIRPVLDYDIRSLLPLSKAVIDVPTLDFYGRGELIFIVRAIGSSYLASFARQ
jgi:hypothetical protein